jgi:ketosteroid isomerase-like protein
MATNKEIIRKVNAGFSSGDDEAVLLHVADDVRWEINWDGKVITTHIGKEAFAKEINNEGFEGLPTIKVNTEIEEGDHVAVQGEVSCLKKGGDLMEAYFFDLYRLENGMIKDMKSFLLEKK